MKILLIDDDEDIRKIGKRSLEAVGKFRTSVAPGADEGIALAKIDRPDLILMDVMMPGKDGLSALVDLRSDPELKHIPVVFMTAKVQRAEVEHYLAVGAIGVVKKPFDPMTLSDEIRHILATSAR